MSRSVRLATRGSALALWQTRYASSLLGGGEEKVIETRGDVDRAPMLAGRLDKGFFTAELEVALRQGEADVAVHSLKDLPTQMPAGLCLGAVLPRADARDCLLIRRDAYAPGQRVPVKDGGRVGASSLRRMALLRQHSPGLKPTPLRGNVPTRLRKLAEGEYEAIVLACAGVLRLQLDLAPFVVFALSPAKWVPAPGQGAVALQCRIDDRETLDRLATIDHRPSRAQVTAERAFLEAFEAGCSSPFGAYAGSAQTVIGREENGAFKVARTASLPDPTATAAKAVLHSLVFAEESGDVIEHL
jgi:hydroxymethylbilane synthase